MFYRRASFSCLKKIVILLIIIIATLIFLYNEYQVNRITNFDLFLKEIPHNIKYITIQDNYRLSRKKIKIYDRVIIRKLVNMIKMEIVSSKKKKIYEMNLKIILYMKDNSKVLVNVLKDKSSTDIQLTIRSLEIERASFSAIDNHNLINELDGRMNR